MALSDALTGQAALVTGGARGLGYAIAEALGGAGAGIVVSDLDGDGATEAADRLRGHGIDAQPVAGDVSSVPEVEAMVSETVRAFGRLDILVNNAGGSAETPLTIEEVSEEHFDRVMNWNLRGTFFSTKAALPHLKSRGGSVINMASIAGRAGTEMVSPHYSAAKAGIIGMTRNLARHLGPFGIRVNVIAPGFIKSGPRVDAIWAARDESVVLNQVPLRRRGEAGEIGQTAVFLASSMSSYVTGAVIDVNGGFLAV